MATYRVTTDKGEYEIETDAGTSQSQSQAPPPAMNVKPPIPAGLQQPSSDQNAWNSPTTGLIGQGVRQAVGGVQHMAQPGRDAKYEGATDIIQGAGKALTPVAIGATLPALVNAPAATLAGAAIGAVGATAGGMAGSLGNATMGGSPAAQNFYGTVGGLAGGALGGWAGSKLPNAFRVDPNVAINRSLRPVPSNDDFGQRLPQTLNSIKAANPGFKPQVQNGELNLAPAINKTINAHQDALEPWLQRMEGTKISGAPVVQATRDAVSKMLPTEQGAGQGLVEQAQRDYSQFSPRALRARLALLNQRLSSFYNSSGQRQSAALADIPESVLKAQRDAVADTLYKHLDPENMGAGPRDIQSKTGDLIDLRDAAVRRQNAIVAEQPLTPFGRLVDPIKQHIRELIPGKATGSGIAFAEGSEGRSLPLLRRAFKGADEVSGANDFGSLPRPGPRQIAAPPDPSGSLPPGVADFRSVGANGGPWPRGASTRQPLMLPPASSGIGVSGTTVPDIIGRSTRGVGSSTPLLPPPPAGQPPLNVLPRGPGAIGPAGSTPLRSTETGIQMPSQAPPPPAGYPSGTGGPPVKVSMDDVAAFAQKNLIPFTEAAQRLQQMGFEIGSGLPGIR